MLRNLGGAVGTAMLATIITKREQFHSNIIGQSSHAGREEVRHRIAEMTNYFVAHGVPDPAPRSSRRSSRSATSSQQALVMGFSDTFAVIGVVLAIAGVAMLVSARQVKARPAARIEVEHSLVNGLDTKAQPLPVGRIDRDCRRSLAMPSFRRAATG